jgi:NAD(P)-dependent dehydrogenase (short-subunit alcohol dehydrogenase family)
VAECDVSSNERVTQAVDAAAEALGGLDVVVANAGIATGGPLRFFRTSSEAAATCSTSHRPRRRCVARE